MLHDLLLRKERIEEKLRRPIQDFEAAIIAAHRPRPGDSPTYREIRVADVMPRHQVPVHGLERFPVSQFSSQLEKLSPDFSGLGRSRKTTPVDSSLERGIDAARNKAVAIHEIDQRISRPP